MDGEHGLETVSVVKYACISQPAYTTWLLLKLLVKLLKLLVKLLKLCIFYGTLNMDYESPLCAT